MLALESQAHEWADQGAALTDDQALAAFDRLLAWHRDSGSPRATTMMYRTGQMESRLGHWSAAEAHFRTALSATLPSPAQGRFQQIMAYVLLKQARHDEALDYFDQAIATLDADGDRYELALTSNNRCLVFHEQGDMAAAAACLSRAADAYEQAGIDGYRGIVLINLGAAYSALGRHDEAQQAFATARQHIAHLPADESIRIEAGLDLHETWEALASGRYRDALERGLSGQAKAEQSSSAQTWGQLMRATAAALLALGQTERAREQIEALLGSAELMRAVTDPARVSFAAARLDPDPVHRATRMEAVMSAARTAHDDLTYLRAWMELARTQQQLGQFEQAAVAARGSLAMAKQMRLAEVEIDALMLISDSVSSTEAIELQQSALELALQAGRTEDQFLLWSALSREWQRAGDWVAARAAVEAADEAFRLLRMSLSSEEQAGLRERLRSHSAGRVAAGLLDPMLADQAKADWVWARLEGSRHWSTERAAPTATFDQGDLEQLLVPPRMAQPVSAADLRQLEARRFQLERLDRRLPDGPWLDWRLIQDGLTADEALVAIVADEPVSAALILHANGVDVLPLGSGSELQHGLGYLLQGLGRQDPMGQGALQARVVHLKGLLADLPDRLQNMSNLGYLPSPGLEALPLELLLSKPPEKLVRFSPGNLSQGGFASRWQALDPKRVMILQVESTPTTSADQRWSALPAAGDEVAQLLRLMPVGDPKVYQGSNAARIMTSTQVASGYDLVHVAGHAFSNDYWSALDELAFGPDPDARVVLGALRQQPWHAELVVLGACRTAYGDGGDLGLGFAQGFLQAGAQRVLASGWPVDDAGTAHFMAHFYAGLMQEDLDPAAALAQAQSLMRADPRWSEPYWWAGYHLWQAVPTGTTTQLAAGR
ncbi:MAG: CHAT domain-containing protein [Lysobacterales bacterium]